MDAGFTGAAEAVQAQLSQGTDRLSASALASGTAVVAGSLVGDASVEGGDGLETGVGSGGRVLPPAPLQDELRADTLFPETDKLYFHGDEVVRIAADPLGRYFATACKARDEATAEVKIWDALTCGPVCSLGGHASTACALAFSPCGKYLVTASKDRHACVYAVDVGGLDAVGGGGADAGAGERGEFVLAVKFKAHKRIVFDASWTHDSSAFVTCGREGTVKVWRLGLSEGGATVLSEGPALPVYEEAVTAVAFGTKPIESLVGESTGSGMVLAVGTESGRVDVWACARDRLLQGESKDGSLWQLLGCAKAAGPSSGIVRQLAWRPGTSIAGDTSRDEQEGRKGSSAWESQLAVASADGTMRILLVVHGASR